MSDLQTDSVIISFIKEEEEESPFVLFEVPDTNVPCDKPMPIYLRSAVAEKLDGYTLHYEQESMGVGTFGTIPSDKAEWQEEVSFAEDSKIELERPINSIIELTGTYHKAIFDGDQVVDIEEYNGGFKKVGGSAIAPKESGAKLYGSGILTYKMGRYYKKWEWPVDCSKKHHWFFIKKNGVFKNKFEITVDAEEPQNIGKRAVLLRIFEFSSEAPVEGAEVKVDGVSWGTTDAYGEVYREGVSPGTYSLEITRDGFLNSWEDEISNDELVVK